MRTSYDTMSPVTGHKKIHRPILNPGYRTRLYQLSGTAHFPNNDRLPVVHYQQVLRLPVLLKAMWVRHLLKQNGWSNTWRAGIFPYDHFHSNAHEALVVLNGETSIALGGEHMVVTDVKAGDVLVIPAGVAHKNIGTEDAVTCIGAYAGGKKYDLRLGWLTERCEAEANISKVPLPYSDPVFGQAGEIMAAWREPSIMHSIP